MFFKALTGIANRFAGKKSTRSISVDNSPMSERMLAGIDTQKRIAFALIALFFGGLVGWSLVFQLASAAIAPGIVSPEGARRPVQHLEGGIIAKVLVKDGDRVIKGQPLVVLRETRAKAQVDQLTDQRSILQMRLQRLLAERRLEDFFDPGINDMDRLDRTGPQNQRFDDAVFPAQAGSANPELAKALAAMRSKRLITMQAQGGAVERKLPALPKPELVSALNMELEIFRSRREALLSQDQILQTQISQLREEIQGLKNQIVSIDDQLALIKEEVQDAKSLFERGLGRKPRLLALQRQQSGLEGQRATATARIARADQSVSGTEAQIADLRTRYVEAADREMSEVRTELVQIVNQLLASEDILARTTLTAPDSGIVVGLTTTAENAVVRPGDVILEIVPDDAALLIDARVSPLDIDDVREGQMAQVHLLAYKQRHMPRFDGIVLYVSADRLIDERTGESYFLARVAVDEKALRDLAPEVDIIPGMPAEVMIATGEQTLFDYLIGPLNQTLRRSFREK